MPKDNAELLLELEEAITYLREADSQNSSKGKAIKSWFSSNFNQTARASIVNEAKQAGNRAKEQLSKRDADHVIFIITDENAFEPLVRNCLELVYPELKTVFFGVISEEDESVTPLFLLANIQSNSTVEKFYREVYPNIKIQNFGPTPDSSESAYDQSLELQSEIVESLIPDDNKTYQTVLSLIEDGYAGVIFTGSPGTSKSWYARQVGLKLVKGEIDQILFIQFHPGYQYEDFIESYVPNESGGFEIADKIFLKACKIAQISPEKPTVLIIDELSRTDVVRVFGEALTYVEKANRGLKFQLSSGRPCAIPDNLIIICTMNPWDRGVDELDLAFERRFAKISFEPDIELLKNELLKSDLSEHHRRGVEQFFYIVSRHPNKLCKIGHAYFMKAKSEESLKRLWDHQLAFHFERTLKNDQDQLDIVKAAWSRIFQA